jgi:hypothetical protein
VSRAWLRVGVGAIALGFLGLVGCPFYGSGRQKPITPPREPRPLTSLNSPYDDFNAAAPFQSTRENLIFSSNRGTKGQSFDLLWAEVRIERSELTAIDGPRPYAVQAMSPENELGPTLVLFGPPRLVFASDRPGGAGDLDLWWYPMSTEHPPKPFSAVNSPAGDAYWTWADGAKEAYFASNRGGDWDIYALSPPLPNAAGQAHIRRVDELCSPQDDTAPFLFLSEASYEPPAPSLNPGRGAPPPSERHWYLLLASKRAHGNFDLYCSRLDGQRWLEPRPLHVNTPAREFRPITVLGGAGIVFSSDRPGGAGGMDLWYAALENPCRP